MGNSAEIYRCGHTCHLMEVDFIHGAPQVHIHFLTDEGEAQEFGFSKVELCCHGCGESLLVYYNEDNSERSVVRVRNEFTSKHRGCKDRGFMKVCPDWRTSFSTRDLRRPKRERLTDPLQDVRVKVARGEHLR